MKKLIITTTSIEGFFHELMDEVLLQQSVQLSDASSAYLVQLVSGFVNPSVLHPDGTETESGTPALFRLYETAISAPPAEQFNAYRKLGDISLFVSSFFSAQIEKSTVSFDYYSQMGGGAYDRAAALDRTGNMRALMRQLSQKFNRVVEILTQVAERTSLPLKQDLTSLYERWVRNPNGSNLYERLIRQGAVPISCRGTKV